MYSIKKIFISDKDYPASLKKIKDPPKTIYYSGILPKEDENYFAIVGTRHCSPYGQQTALKFSEDLCNAGLVVVSGLAPGIDTFAHKAVIENQGRTIAVLGTGIDEQSIYPKTNLGLSKKILENGGCLISELPPGSCGTKFTFPRRNRIISGLSIGVLVIEAKEKSGSLITADCAKKQNKKIFAVPGPIYSLNSKGPNKLIKEGAFLVEKPEDILERFSIKILNLKQNKISVESLEEELIISVLKQQTLHIDKIIEATKLEASVTASTLALMEISGKIRNLGQGIYTIN